MEPPSIDRTPYESITESRAAGPCALAWSQFPLDVVHELGVQVEQLAQVAGGQQQVLASVGQAGGARFGLIQPGLEVGYVLPQSRHALAGGRSPTRSAISSRMSGSLLSGVKLTGVRA